MPLVYKITYPNGKIYVGQDRTDTLNYFGSADSTLIERDFSEAERRDFSVRKETLWQDAQALPAEVSAVEIRFIRELRANDPTIGYNQWPRSVPMTGSASPLRSRGDASGRGPSHLGTSSGAGAPQGAPLTELATQLVSDRARRLGGVLPQGGHVHAFGTE